MVCDLIPRLFEVVVEGAENRLAADHPLPDHIVYETIHAVKKKNIAKIAMVSVRLTGRRCQSCLPKDTVVSPGNFLTPGTKEGQFF